MDRLSLPRHAVAGYIKLARLPLDTTVKLAVLAVSGFFCGVTV